MTEILFTQETYDNLTKTLLSSPLESAAILTANVINHKNGTKLLVNEIFHVLDENYLDRGRLSVMVNPAFFVPIVNKAKKEGRSIIFAHTHPHCELNVKFSKTDDFGEAHLKKYLDGRNFNAPHAALVFGRSSCSGRLLGESICARVISVGSDYIVRSDPENRVSIKTDLFDRQIRAFGKSAQEVLGQICVGIVGTGGTGSVVGQQLAHLGIKKYLLIDPEDVEATNLNRLVGSDSASIGKKKVEVAKKLIQGIRPDAEIETDTGSVLDVRTALKLVSTNIFFCCTDSHGSRAVLNQLAYQYLTPCIDMGVSISTKSGRVTHVTGRVQLLSPGVGCLTCGNFLDPDQIRYDLMTPFERKKDPYFIGQADPEPAVISLNSTVASLAITMFLAVVTGIPIKARHQIYTALDGRVRAVHQTPDPVCIVCSKRGFLARADEWPLSARRI